MSLAAAARRAPERPRALAAAAVRTLTGLALVLLVCFHLFLLGLQFASGQAFEPATAVRWVLAALVLAGFRALSRRGLPLVIGRRAIGLWLLVFVIHASAAWDGGGIAFGAAIPESAAALAQLSATAFLLGALVIAAAALAARIGAATASRLRGPSRVSGLPSTGFLFSFSPRPPPLA